MALLKVVLQSTSDTDVGNRPTNRHVKKPSECPCYEKWGCEDHPEELMDAHDVSSIVNSAKYDGSECIRPVSDDEIPRVGQLSLL
jgi:hypothetical protein